MKRFLKLGLIIIICFVTLFSCKKEVTRTNISGSVMLYSSMEENTLREIKKAFEAKYPGVTLDYYFTTADRINNRLYAEKSVEQLNCDVIWAGSQLDFEKYKEEEYLTPYKSKENNRIHKIFIDKDNYYTGARAAAVGFAYLSDKNTRINSYEDLLSENFENQIVMPDPERASIVKIFVLAMMQNKKYGEEYFKKFFSNGATIINSVDDGKKMVKNGEKQVFMTIDYLNTIMNEDEDSYTFSYPSKDVVFYYTPVGLAKDCFNPDNGKLLIDFILSKEGQNIIASTGNLSTRKDLKSVIKTEKYFSKAMKIDIKDLYDNVDTYISKFNSLK